MSSISSKTLKTDWFGTALCPPIESLLRMDSKGIFFQATRATAGSSHPQSQPSQFTEELWHYDVAEAFFLEPESGRYLEVNLAPNGAWWACWHSGPRIREKQQPAFDSVVAQGESHPDRWQAHIFLPQNLFSSMKTLRFNITFILNSPAQTFHSLAKLPGEQPDFHQPDSFLRQ